MRFFTTAVCAITALAGFVLGQENPLIKPDNTEALVAGKTFTITWTPTTTGPITLTLKNGISTDLKTVATIVCKAAPVPQIYFQGNVTLTDIQQPEHPTPVPTHGPSHQLSPVVPITQFKSPTPRIISITLRSSLSTPMLLLLLLRPLHHPLPLHQLPKHLHQQYQQP